MAAMASRPALPASVLAEPPSPPSEVTSTNTAPAELSADDRPADDVDSQLASQADEACPVTENDPPELLRACEKPVALQQAPTAGFEPLDELEPPTADAVADSDREEAEEPAIAAEGPEQQAQPVAAAAEPRTFDELDEARPISAVDATEPLASGAPQEFEPEADARSIPDSDAAPAAAYGYSDAGTEGYAAPGVLRVNRAGMRVGAPVERHRIPQYSSNTPNLGELYQPHYTNGLWNQFRFGR